MHGTSSDVWRNITNTLGKSLAEHLGILMPRTEITFVGHKDPQVFHLEYQTKQSRGMRVLRTKELLEGGSTVGELAQALHQVWRDEDETLGG